MATTALVLVALALPPSPGGFPATVVAVADGDTLNVVGADRAQVRVRIHGIDAPELGQDFRRRVEEHASALAAGPTVTILATNMDRYGRTVADVRLEDGRFLGTEMVRAGLAWHYVRYSPADGELARAEAEARRARAGVWSTPDPVPPREFRRVRGEEPTAKVVGNRRNFLDHAPSCRGVASMKEGNRAESETAAEAEASGFRQAVPCNYRR